MDIEGFNNRMVYLGGPIDLVGFDEAGDWRQGAAEILARRAYATFDPFAAFSNVARDLHGHQVMAINRTAIQVCGMFFARFESESIGTSRELEICRQFGKPVFLWCRQQKEYARLEKAISTSDCMLILEPYLGDALRVAVNHMEAHARKAEEELGQLMFEINEPQSEEDDPA